MITNLCKTVMMAIFCSFCGGCLGTTENDSVAGKNDVFIGAINYRLSFGDTCRYDFVEGEGKNRIFVFRNSELVYITFTVDSSLSSFLLQDSQLVSASAFVSYTKDGPSWSHRLTHGAIRGRRDSTGIWFINASGLTPASCAVGSYSFDEQPFYTKI